MKKDALSAPVVDTFGKAKGTVQLPVELFGAKINKQLLAQAVRVHLANRRVGTASSKTRGEVEGSTRKIYRQKGTGRARHGAIRAPIFVGGGIVFGPKPREYRLEMPKKMKRAALAGALTSQLTQGNIVIVDGLGEVSKTKAVALTLRAVEATSKTLLVTAPRAFTITRAARNIADLEVIPVTNLHAYAILSHQKVVFTKDAISSLKKS